MHNKIKGLFIAVALVVGVLSGCAGGTEQGNTDNGHNSGPVVITATPTPGTPVTPIVITATPTPTSTPAPTPTLTPTPTTAPVDPALDTITWQQFMASMGIGWNLGNTFDAFTTGIVGNELRLETMWTGAPATSKEMIDTIKEAGFTSIRIPVSWNNHVTVKVRDDGHKEFIISEAWMNRVKEVVDYAIDDGLYVIINIHHDNTECKYIYPTKDYRESSIDYLQSIWSQIATVFGDYDYHLMFETMNEPRITGRNEWNPAGSDAREAQKYINEYNQVAVDVIRNTPGKYNRARFIGCPGYCGSIDTLDNGWVLPTDRGGYEGRILASIHAYTPYQYAMTTNLSYYNVEQEVQRIFTKLDMKLLSKNIPCYIGEYGVINGKEKAETKLSYIKKYIGTASTYCRDKNNETVKVPCIIWDNCVYTENVKEESYGLLDRNTCTWNEPEYIKTLVESWVK